MYRFKKILVDLNMDERDDLLIQYASLIAGISKAEKVYFVHVLRSFDIPEKIQKEYPEIMEPIDEYEMRHIQEKVDEHFKPVKGCTTKCEVLEGAHMDTLLHFISYKHVDLVLNTRPESKYDLYASIRLERKAPCSILNLPSSAKADLSNMIIPLDFNEQSEYALDTAISFANASGMDKLFCLHLFRVPVNYYKTGKNFKEFAEIMKQNALDEFNGFTKNIDKRGVEVVPLIIPSDDYIKKIKEVVSEYDCNLALIGARGRSAGAVMLLGSLTESLIKKTDIPVLAVKKKGSGLNVIQALLEI